MKLTYIFMALLPLSLLANPPKKTIQDFIQENKLQPQKTDNASCSFETPEGKFTVYKENNEFTFYQNGTKLTKTPQKDIIEFILFCAKKQEERIALQKLDTIDLSVLS